MLESGKRYIWHIFHRIHKSGIFTGKYDKNGNGIFIEDETGETWVIPEEDCIRISKN